MLLLCCMLAQRTETSLGHLPFIYSISSSLGRSAVVLDEAHNIEDTSREAATKAVTRDELAEAARDFKGLAAAGNLMREW